MIWIFLSLALTAGFFLAFSYGRNLAAVALLIAAAAAFVVGINQGWGSNSSGGIEIHRESGQSETDGKKIREQDIENIATEGFDTGYGTAEEKRRRQEVNREPKIRHLAGGACEVTFFSPPPALIKTGCTFGPSEAFYVRTDREVQNLGVGARSLSSGETKVVSPKQSFTRKPLMFANSKNEQRELVFTTGGTYFNGGSCTIFISKSAGALAADEYSPGVRADRIFQ